LRFESQFLPDLGEALTFAIIIAEHMNGVPLPRPAMQLDKAGVDFEAGLIDLNPVGRKQNKKYRPKVKLPPFLRELLGTGKGR